MTQIIGAAQIFPVIKPIITEFTEGEIHQVFTPALILVHVRDVRRLFEADWITWLENVDFGPIHQMSINDVPAVVLQGIWCEHVPRLINSQSPAERMVLDWYHRATHCRPYIP